ncbi:hypothetical protein LMG28614_00024 [Paraburkholderia ultramafica]|uniref:HTH lysR-type domain-containing protein n=1 Tax=Paraburkholderia ultramafica TaxID=1544867 RepID=A0A6S7ARL0_9BURK|nr:hypothetical protein LMG28614_00024 [Paraburkholderia ultramafica]
MLDGVSLDQLRTFIAAVDEGSFSGAARKLRRAQSMVSELVANLEGQIGVTLFDRSGRYPLLTAEGRILLADARSVIAGVDWMKARAKGMASGLEPELAVVLDAFFPIDAFIEAAKPPLRQTTMARAWVPRSAHRRGETPSWFRAGPSRPHRRPRHLA